MQTSTNRSPEEGVLMDFAACEFIAGVTQRIRVPTDGRAGEGAFGSYTQPVLTKRGHMKCGPVSERWV